MLERLFIRNFALIEDMAVELGPNFIVLTGETGAGKSIVVDAVSVLLGGRAMTEFIRTGAEKAVVEGVLVLPPDHPVYQFLQEAGIEEEDGTIVMTREIQRNGRNVCRINGRTVTLTRYRQAGLLMVDIHGQHNHQALLQADKHLELLDRYGGNEHLALKKEVREKYRYWSSIKSELKELMIREQERLQRVDFLQFQIQEIENAKLRPGELEELQREALLLLNAEKVHYHLQAAYGELYGGEKGQSAYDWLSKAINNLTEIQKMDPSLEPLIQNLESSLYVLEEVASELRDYQEKTEVSPYRLEENEKRIRQIKDICKKYGPTEEEALANAQKAREELLKWKQSEERIQGLEKEQVKAWESFLESGQQLSKYRKRIARELEKKVTAELKELAMLHACFSVSFQECEPSEKGLEQVEFVISPNPGEPLLPVAKIASGGELSRIMLALKTILADLDEIGTLIFDEIDAGIGGKAAQKVAEKLEQISKSQQVICVTHSPLIAALADHHLLLEKEVREDRTVTSLRYLEEEERVEELTRMLGGEKQTADLRKHALQMIKKNKN